jgi:hypothetical protein
VIASGLNQRPNVLSVGISSNKEEKTGLPPMYETSYWTIIGAFGVLGMQTVLWL